MTIQIEILDVDKDTVRAAFYYPVPANIKLPGAVDATRQPSGTRLAAADLPALQDGTLFEFIVTAIVTGMTPAQIASALNSMYADATVQAQAAAQYSDLYTNKQYLHSAYENAVWS